MDVMKRFEQQKSQVEKALEKVLQITDELNGDLIYQALLQTKNHLQKEKFTVSVVGEFSRGKSTFINALLGEAVLPMKTRPTTTVLNKIRYGDSKKYEVIYYDNLRPAQILNEEEFGKLVAPMEPLEDDHEDKKKYERLTEEYKAIEAVHIQYPSSLCRNNVELIDTPGVNDLLEAREEITNKIIPQSDVAIMLLSAAQPLSKSEFDFLKIRIMEEAHIQKIFFVVNFKDHFENTSQAIKSQKYIEEKLSEIIKQPKVYMVSAKDYLNHKRLEQGVSMRRKPKLPLEQTGIEELETSLRYFLANDRGAVKLSKPIKELQTYCAEIDNTLIQISMGALNQPLEELERRLQDIQEEIKKVKKSRDRLVRELRTNMNESGELMKKTFASRFKSITTSAEAAVSSYDGSVSVKDLSRKVNSVTLPQMRRIEKDIHNGQKELIEEEIERVGRLFEGEWDNVLKKVDFHFSNTEDEKAVKQEMVAHSYDDHADSAIKASSYGSIGLAGLVGIAGVSFFFALPLVIAGGFKLFEHLKAKQEAVRNEKVKNQVVNYFKSREKDAVKMIETSWEERVRLLEDYITREISRKIGTIEHQMKNVMQERTKQEATIEQQKESLLEKREKLNSINQEMQKLYKELQKNSSITQNKEEEAG